MFGIEHYWVFLLSGLLLNITPGSDTLFIIGRTVSQGKTAGLLSVFGIITGAFAHTLLAALGLSAVLMHSAMAFNLVKWIGAGYLIYLGIKSILTKQEIGKEVGPDSEGTKRNIYFQGLLTNLFNPKVALFYLAFLPQFVSADHSYGVLPFLLLGLTFITTGTLWCCLLVVIAGWMTRSVRKGSLGKVLNKVTGVIFVSLGLKLLGATRT
jgi:threonine/homoserine/homoserine lactone efflux protein